MFSVKIIKEENPQERTNDCRFFEIFIKKGFSIQSLKMDTNELQLNILVPSYLVFAPL
jgi:hypothetical protein